MIKQIDSSHWLKLNGLTRYILSHTASKYLPLYIVNEYPKSGGSWISEMLSDALEIPFPRNRLPMLQRSIIHGHMWHRWNMHNVLIVWRDGRDVLVSQYFHSLFKNERGNAKLVEHYRNALQLDDYNNIKANLPAFMQYVYNEKKHPRFSWGDFVQHWGDCPHCTHVTYEKMREKPVKELQRIVYQMSGKNIPIQTATEIVDKHSFKKASGREPGEENTSSFMRKGIVGDWRNHFTQTAKEQFQKYAGKELIKLEYENNNDWVHNTLTPSVE